jgi:DNA-binding NarL/FixJ family response regulator
LEQLTRRERQIAGLLSHGLSNKQIARDLSIELSTVKNHVHNILVKVGAHSRTQAVLILQNSLLSPGSRSLDLELHY